MTRPPDASVIESPARKTLSASRLRSLQALGIFCGFAAGAWLGGAEAPIKLVKPDVSPITVSLIMVFGVFLARWSVPAFLRGVSHVGRDVRQAPHLVVWAILAGAMWAVANTLTIYAIRNVGLSIAFPLWNTNSLLGIFWGFLLFKELHHAGWKQWLGVIGGAVGMFGGATLLAIASSHQAVSLNATAGILAALGAGILWGTMYIPYRKAYLTGMNPLSFVTFFTIGELATMSVLAIAYLGAGPLYRELISARPVLFWLMLGGFVWVIGDLFQQFATKYVGISRGIPLSNTNQLWGLLWGIFVFHELSGESSTVYAQVAGGSLLMALGALAISLSSATEGEHAFWHQAAEREGQRYGVEAGYIQAGLEGLAHHEGAGGRTFVDWLLIGGTTGLFAILAALAKFPQVSIGVSAALALGLAMFVLLLTCGVLLWRRTGFR
ncbi:MAG TPA: GRP family sugar transporter [Candidatus Sulfotelmatobacter sp.]|nr:GRP family sugar transporter [Candidatus Sulfotelmatobacter sp.]